MSVREVEAIRDAGCGVYVIAAGAGAGIQEGLWRVPGIGKVLVGAAFPYHGAETADLLGFTPERYVCAETAVDLATAAYLRAKGADPGRPAAGLGLTAAVASAREHRGGLRVHAAVVNDRGCWRSEVEWPKTTGAIPRAMQGRQCDWLGLELLEWATAGSPVEPTFAPRLDAAEELAGRLWERPYFAPDGTRHPNAPPNLGAVVLFPGSFNPLHDGHRAMAAHISKPWQQVVYTLDAGAPHKPSLDVPTLLARVAALRADRRAGPERNRGVLCTRAPLFVDKARARPGSIFLIGTDTLDRLLDPKWGVPSWEVVRQLQNHGAAFYVFPRRHSDGSRASLAQVLPTRLGDRWREAGIFLEVEADVGAYSSTALRAAADGGGVTYGPDVEQSTP